MHPSWLLARLRRVPAREVPVRAARALRDRWAQRGVPETLPPEGAWDEGWPRRASSTLDLLGASRDARSAWEAARLIGATPEEASRFCAAHPPGVGLAWASAAEAAHRLVCLFRLRSQGLEAHLWTHAAWIADHPTPPSSAFNHRVAELSALALAVSVHPSPPRSWRRQAETLPEVLARQLHPDGLGVEQAPAYLGQVVEWGLLARSVGARGLDEPLARATAALAALLDPGGHAPDLGDDDGGCVLPGPRDRYLLSVVGAACCALHLPAPAAWRPDERSGALAPGRRPSGIREERSLTFPDAGLTVLRSPRLRAVFDHGPLGGPPLDAHGHADALGLWLSVDGRPVLGGRGTGRYVGDPALRRFHRGTSSHPTAVVDGADQSQPHDHPFLWRTRARATLEAADLSSGVVIARHDGYLATRGVVHRREVRLEGDRLELRDRLEGRGRHHLAVVLPLAPGASLTVHPDPRCLARERSDLHRPAYGAAGVPATTLCLEATVAAGEEVVTRLLPA